MSRTVKWEHQTDSWHISHRLERQARPAGRILGVLAAEMEDGPEPWDLCFVPAESDVEEDFTPDPFCYVCGRCTDHFAEHCDLVELGYCFYAEDGSVMWTEAGRKWDMLFDKSIPLPDDGAITFYWRI